MTKVYILQGGSGYDPKYVSAVFSKRELAQEFIDKCLADDIDYWEGHFKIIEFEVDKSLTIRRERKVVSSMEFTTVNKLIKEKSK